MENIKDEKNYILCECGNKIYKTNVSSHKKRPKHINLMKEKEKENENKNKNFESKLIDILKKYGLQIKNEDI